MPTNNPTATATHHYNKDHGITVFHASPQLSLGIIQPRFSPKFQGFGIFVTTSKESIWKSWGYWASRKAVSSHSPKRASGGLHHDKVAVYTCHVPRDLFKESERQHWARAEECGNSYGAWGCDVETFLPSSLFPSLVPTSKKVYTFDELRSKEHGLSGHRGRSHQDPVLEASRKLWNNPAAKLYHETHEYLALLSLNNPEVFKGMPSTVSEVQALRERLVPLFYKSEFFYRPYLRVKETLTRRLNKGDVLAFEEIRSSLVDLLKMIP